MGRRREDLPLKLGILAVIVCAFSVAWAVGELRQSRSAPVCDSTAAITPAAGELPDGLVVEAVLADTPILNPDLTEMPFRSRISYACLESASGTFMIVQDFAGTMIVTDGKLRFRLTAPCIVGDSAECLGNDGVAYLYTADEPATRQELVVSEHWTVLEPGDVLIAASVLAELRTAPGSHARFIAAGIAVSTDDSGGSPTAGVAHALGVAKARPAI